ncbi:MAG: low temperature requirement protein A [Pelatocladus maniniholoensis HA4357-MV3]|jgi:low temperature requirement protein LtrA|uniref:Low temperature requirement protein A n=1 Tax=Pelatocladus maniniholoensis HA4357-MV3 TaxID=1117104 RepID=A0A9E3HF71_9NOST|nr:low temperature requirement protein A [Pelatocladus maniniholoensis HA4357-MV3]BAZ69874.1 low temperature requirement A [Fischerella sp. NIES-4106]
MNNFLQPPRLRISENDEEERRATWLELFYDLVFVVAVSELAHNLKEDVSISGYLGFIFLFIPVWWSWIGNTMYANRFDSDDIGRRFLVALQMLAAAALAVNIHHGLGESASGFALSYTLARAVLIVEYVRAGIHIPAARQLTTRYATGFAIAAVFWLISAFVPAPGRFVLWGLGIMVDLITPFTATKFQLKLLPHASHLPERFGLFTIIVLGEAIIAVVEGVSEQKWDVLSVIAAILGLAIAFSLWWVYFDNLGGTPIQTARAQGKVGTVAIWLYTHLPLVIGIAGTGVGVEKVLTSEQAIALSDAQRWLLCGSVALCYLALGILHRVGVIRYCKIRSQFRGVAAMIVIAIAFFGKGLLPVAVIGLVTVVCVVQVAQDLYQSRPTTRLVDPEI